MAHDDTHPTLPLPDPSPQQAEPAPKRRVWPWIVGMLIVAALAVGAWFAGEAIARSLVTSTIREQIVAQLDLPADQEIAVDVPGAVVPQLIGGSLGTVAVSSDDVPFRSLTADVSVIAHDVPVRGDEPIGEASATVSLDEEQLRALAATVDGFPADKLALAEPDVTFTTELSFFGVEIPVGVSLTPGAADGELILTPTGIEVAGAAVTAERLKEQFGVVADVVLKDWRFCLAEQLPAAVTITDVRVDGDELVADLSVDGSVAVDPSLTRAGTCA